MLNRKVKTVASSIINSEKKRELFFEYLSIRELPFMTRDLRKYAGQTNTRSLIGFIVILFLVGDGLIYALYGRESAVMGLVCIPAGGFPFFLVWVFSQGMGLFF